MSLGTTKATKIGNVFLLVFPISYDDGFDGRCGGFWVMTLGLRRFDIVFLLVLGVVLASVSLWFSYKATLGCPLWNIESLKGQMSDKTRGSLC